MQPRRSMQLIAVSPTISLTPARDVKAYVKRNKNDAADAEAICEAVRRLARSKPIVLICMWSAPSCDSSTTITLWHFDAGSGRRSLHQQPTKSSSRFR